MISKKSRIGKLIFNRSINIFFVFIYSISILNTFFIATVKSLEIVDNSYFWDLIKFSTILTIIIWVDRSVVTSRELKKLQPNTQKNAITPISENNEYFGFSIAEADHSLHISTGRNSIILSDRNSRELYQFLNEYYAGKF